MTVADIPAVGQLFLKTFRGIQTAGTPEFQNYLKTLVFDSPLYSEALGSSIYAQEDGCIRSAVIAIPMQFVAHGRILPARLLCAYMTDAQNEAAGAATLALNARAKHQELAFSDSASPMSRAQAKAMGGVIVTVQNLEWTRTLRPLSAWVGTLERRLGLRIGLDVLTRPLDAAIRAVSSRFDPPAVHALSVCDMPLDTFLDQAPGLIAHYAVRPLWPRDELAWLVKLASQNTSSGPLRMRAVHDRNGGLVGCFLFYGARGRLASVLNVLALKGKEKKVVTAMVHDLDQTGYTAVVGRAQPALMEGLATQHMLTFRHKAFVCLLTRHPDIVLAAERGDIYIGGLAGESWSRLMSDF